MLSVIIEAGAKPEALPPLLAQLTAGAVQGLVREVVIVGARQGVVDWVCEDMGAEPSLAAALRRTQGRLALIVGADFRFREGWAERLLRHLSEGGEAGELRGQGGWLSAPRGILVERGRALGLGVADLQQLRRRLRLPRLH
jgi:hypothetical protein